MAHPSGLSLMVSSNCSRAEASSLNRVVSVDGGSSLSQKLLMSVFSFSVAVLSKAM